VAPCEVARRGAPGSGMAVWGGGHAEKSREGRGGRYGSVAAGEEAGVLDPQIVVSTDTHDDTDKLRDEFQPQNSHIRKIRS